MAALLNRSDACYGARPVRLPLCLLLLLTCLVTPVRAQEEPADPPPAEETMPAPTAAPTAAPTPTPLSAAEIVARISPSVVRLIVEDRTATGLKVAEGVLTTAYFIGDATHGELVSSDGAHTIAWVVRTDRTRDLALLATDLALPAAELEPAAGQRQGDALFVLAHSDGTTGTPALTRGIVAALRQGEFGLDLVQTDASISAGSAGSPLVNERGKVIGLHSFSRGPGLNFGIASEAIASFVGGAAPLAGPVLPVQPPAASSPATPQGVGPFGGGPEDITVRPADLGAEWSVVEQKRDAADSATTGLLRTVLRSASGTTVRVTTAVFRSRELALDAWKLTRGGSLETCEASVYGNLGDGAVGGACLVQNVVLEMSGATYEMTRAAFAASWKRISAAITPTAPPPSAGPLFKGPASAIVVSPGDVGPGWTAGRSEQENPNEYSSGRLHLSFQSSGSETVYVEAEVFRDAETAEVGVRQLTREAGGEPTQGCDGGRAWVRAAESFGQITFPPTAFITCRKANVAMRVTGASPDLGRALIANMLARVKAGLP